MFRFEKSRPVSARPAETSDIGRALLVMSRARAVYLGVSPERLGDRLSEAVAVVAEEPQHGFGFAAAVLRPFDVAVIVAAAVEPNAAIQEYAPSILSRLEVEVQARGARAIAQVGYSPWLVRELKAYGFSSREKIITYQWLLQPVQIEGNAAVTLRPAKPGDLPRLLALDRQLFGPVWHKGSSELEAALDQAFDFTVAWTGDAIVGYQWSDLSDDHGHLTRLAVASNWQKRGVGTRLLTEVMSAMVDAGAKVITLNTQSTNVRAQDLYRRYGFDPLHDQIDLLWKDLSRR